MAGQRQLPLQSEKILSYSIRPHLLAYSSRTDLFAVVTEDESIEVFRFGGQRAFSVKRKSPQISINGLQWIRNGKCLAVALSNGYVDIVSGETGKIIRHGGDDPFSTKTSNSTGNRGSITCLGWGTVLTSNTSRKDSSTRSDEDPTTEEWYDRLQEKRGDVLLTEDDHELKGQKASMSDLPRQLAFMDVESVLPRLSPIPTRHTASGRYDMFATQAALDDYFNSMQRRDRLAADVMFVGYSGHKHRIVVDDILEITYYPNQGSEQDSMDDSEMNNEAEKRQLLLYASHHRSEWHALLRGLPDESEDNESDGYKDLEVTLFSLPLLSSGGSHLHLIVSRTAQLRDLCGYISYSIIAARSDWTTHTNLPSRFMENVNETLEEKNEGVLEQNLFHLAMTGNFTPTILEWLRDELAERGHKRWDHAMTSLYTELSKIFLTNLLPVLERCSVVATNLRGLSLYYTSTSKFDVSPETFSDILSVISCLQLLVHEAVQILGQEQRQFRAFSRWLRHQIDLAAADPGSVSARDLAEREAVNLDYPGVLGYLEGPLTNSRLKGIVFSQVEVPDYKPVTVEELVKDIVAARENGGKEEEGFSPLLSLNAWAAGLGDVCKAAHYNISKWQRAARPKTLRFECRVDEGKGVGGLFDMKMVEVKQGSFKTFVIGVPRGEGVSGLTLWTTCMGPEGWKGDTCTQIPLPQGSKPHALKFLDEETFLAIVELKGTRYLLLLPYNTPSTLSTTSTSTPSTTPPTNLTTLTSLTPYIAHTFTTKDGFIPKDMVVNPKVGKRNVCIVAEDYRRWRIFDLEAFRNSKHGGKGEVEEEHGEEDGMLVD